MNNELFIKNGKLCNQYSEKGKEDGRWVAEDDAIGEWVQVKPC